MTKDELRNKYFKWMCRLVYKRVRPVSYLDLFEYLHSVEFSYTIAMDGNRADDGVNLRYRFGYEKSYEDAMIATYLDDRPCSVFEMLVALSFRCEEHIMDDPDIGNRTGQWFWSMLSNLGLARMNNENFDKQRAERIITRFVNREYESNGKGGLFTLKRCEQDLRTVEIWYQLCWYLNEILGYKR